MYPAIHKDGKYNGCILNEKDAEFVVQACNQKLHRDCGMKKIYVAHPYGGQEENKQSVEKIIKKLIKNNPDVLYFSPIHCFEYTYFYVSYEQGMEYCLGILKTCDELILCPGWEKSRGCNIEKKYAEDNSIPINYLEEGNNVL
jgi:hypothetical protein